MKAYFASTIDSWAIYNIVRSMRENLPLYVHEVQSPDAAEIVVLHVVGRMNHVQRTIDTLKKQGKRVALIQYSLRSTRNSNTADWIPLWQSADVVWSYYDLRAWLEQDGHSADFNFYHAPLGIDKRFYAHNLERKFDIATHGNTFEAECLHEIWTAADVTHKSVMHIGKVFDFYPAVTYVPTGGNLFRVAGWYSQCHYISALRRKEGFEMPAAEGLVCGARPIMFDQPHYRKWFDGLVEFIPEASPAEVTKTMIELLNQPARPVTDAEIAEARHRFDWKSILEGFWKHA